MRIFARLSAAFLLFGFFLLTSEVRADSIIITTGSVSLSRGGEGPFSFTGQDLAVSGSLYGGNVRPQLCAPCRPNSTINLSSYFVGYSSISSGSATVGGTFYQNLYYDGAINLQAGSLILPFSDSSFITLTAPFTLDGFLRGCIQSTAGGLCPGGDVFSSTMSGQGIATLQLSSYFDPNFGRLYDFRSIIYDFQASTPIPEPITLLLLGTGLAGVAVRYRRRHGESVQ